MVRKVSRKKKYMVRELNMWSDTECSGAHSIVLLRIGKKGKLVVDVCTVKPQSTSESIFPSQKNVTSLSFLFLCFSFSM